MRLKGKQMKKYSPLFEKTKIEKTNDPIYLGGQEIIVQNPYSMMELNGTRFPVTEKIYKLEIKKIEELGEETDIINKEINEVRQILYNYTLIKVTELQKKVSEN